MVACCLFCTEGACRPGRDPAVRLEACGLCAQLVFETYDWLLLLANSGCATGLASLRQQQAAAASYNTATHSISTSAFSGNVLTANVARAGGFSGKYFP